MTLVDQEALEIAKRNTENCTAEGRRLSRAYVKAANLLASYHTLAQAAGYSDVGEALKAIPELREALDVIDCGDVDVSDTAIIFTKSASAVMRQCRALANGGAA